MKQLPFSIAMILFSSFIYSQKDYHLVCSDTWETENVVQFVFEFKDSTNSALETPKSTFKVLRDLAIQKTTITVNQGYLTNSLGNREWHFNRDSVMLYHNGILRLIASKKIGERVYIDSLVLKLPKIIEIIPNFTVVSYRKYHENIFSNGITYKLDNGKSYTSSFNFYDKESILNTVSIGRSSHLQQNPHHIYSLDYPTKLEDIWIEFFDKNSGKLINKFLIPRTIYIQEYSFKCIGEKGNDGQNGVNGSWYNGNKGDPIPNLDTLKLDGTNGMNGMHGKDAIEVIVRIERANSKDSIAKITCTTKDSTCTYFVDLIHGGTFYLDAKGGRGGEGGDGGSCGSLRMGDSIIKNGVEGKAGIGGDGGKGANVTVYMASFYKNYQQKIIINNAGGDKGFGGYSPEAGVRCWYTSPYNRGSYDVPPSLVFDVILPHILGKSGGGSNTIDNIPKTDKSENLGTSGKKGIDGKIKMVYF